MIWETPVVTEGYVIPWKCPWGVLYDVRVFYLAKKMIFQDDSFQFCKTMYKGRRRGGGGWWWEGRRGRRRRRSLWV
jgi:hypothetical protein